MDKLVDIILNKMLIFYHQPRLILLGLIKHLGLFVPDKLFLSIIYRLKFGRSICWNNPKSFNEKIQWLKLYDRKPEYTIFVDKYKVRDYISKTIGEKYLIPLLGVWDNTDEIDFDKLPNQFVLKCNHNSGLGMCICKDKSKIDIEEVKRELKKGLEEDYYLAWREWPYKNVPRKIIAEKYMVDESGYELKDYKIFNFNGEPKFIQVDFDRFVNHLRNLYTIDWQYIKAKIEYPTAPDRQIPKPKALDEMLELARKLSKGISHVRTDFYCIDNKVYFGEMTFYHGSGFEHFEPEKFGLEIGSWIQFPLKKRVMLYKANVFMVLRFEQCTQSKNNSENNESLKDYKFMCFDGKVKCSFVCSDRFTKEGLHVTFFDTDWNVLPFERHYPARKEGLPKPKCYDEMVILAEKLSKDIPFVRVDFYEINGKVYFGELTFYPGSGFEEFSPQSADEWLGGLIKLPEIKF